MTTYTERFTEVLGDIGEPFYGELMRCEIGGVSFDLQSPVVVYANQVGSAVRYALEQWRTYELPEADLSSQVSWHFDGGNLPLGLAVLDEVCKLLQGNGRPARLLKEPAAVILERIDERAEAFLEVLSQAQRSEIPALAEELFSMAARARHHLNPRETDALTSARSLSKILWLEEPSAWVLKEFLESIRKIKPPFLFRPNEANGLASRLEKLQQELEVQELWDELTAS
jgi:hypothetical protein